MTTTCRRCSRLLKKPSSIKHGYGDTCYRKKMAGDARQGKGMDPCTVTDRALAGRTYESVHRLVLLLDETTRARGNMLAGANINTLPVESFDTDNGVIPPGFGKPQGFYLHSEKYDLAVWKIGITEEKIFAEMELIGDLPDEWSPIAIGCENRSCPR